MALPRPRIPSLGEMMRNILYLLSILLLVGCGSSLSRFPASPTNEASAIEEATQTKQTTAGKDSRPTPIPHSSASAANTSGTGRTELDHQALMDSLLYSKLGSEEARATLSQIEGSRDTRFVAALIDALRYHSRLSVEIGEALNTLTGQALPPEWFEWVEWAGQHPEIESFAGYSGWKSRLYSRIDPSFLRFISADTRVAPDSRVEEIVWGGVLVDGIPALDNPAMIDPAEADYLLPKERVFGISLNGDTRAYPARFLDWHEMFNDVIGGEPVSLAY